MQKPQAETNSPTCVPARNVTLHKLSTESIKHLSAALRSSDAEVAQMIKGICNMRNWSRERLAAIICIDVLELRKYEEMHKHPSGTTARVIWLIYHLLYAPEKAMSLPHIVTWGHIDPAPRVINHELTGERRKQLIAELRACSESKYQLAPKKKSVNQLALHYGLQVKTIALACKEAGYKPIDGRKGTHRRLYGKRKTPPILSASSIWVHVDWSKSIKQIAEEVHVKPRTVTKAFKKLTKVPKAALIRHLKGLGITKINEKFERVFFKIPRRKTAADLFQLKYDEEENNTLSSCQNNTPNNTVANANDEAQSEKHQDVGTQANAGDQEHEVLVQCDPGECQAFDSPQAQGGGHQ